MNVIHVAKQVGVSSMHWNDLYATTREQSPGIAFPTLAIGLSFVPFRFRRHNCADKRRRYFSAGLLSGPMLLAYLSRRSRIPLVVHVHTPVLIPLVLASRALCGRFSLVVTQHNNWSSFRFHQRMCLWLGTVFANVYVPCGKQVGKSLPPSVHKRLLARDGLRPIANGIPSARLRALGGRRYEAQVSRCKADHDRSTVIVAKMEPQKNCMYLLELVAAIPELGKVVWYGHGKLRKALVEKRSALGLEDRVEFAGIVPREEIYDALTKHDFYLTASFWEGLSVADLEAVAIGCVPLMSDIPQRREIAEATGVRLLPPADVEAWRNTVRHYAYMTALERAEIGLNLSRKACSAFSMEQMVTRYIEAYHQAAQGQLRTSST